MKVAYVGGAVGFLATEVLGLYGAGYLTADARQDLFGLLVFAGVLTVPSCLVALGAAAISSVLFRR
ncbi:hypothetical protein ACUXST_001696 [Sphingomonas sp. F9_3S_D5_B_2]